MRKEKISYFRALFTLPLLFAFGLLGILLGTTCNGCDPCCPEITEFRADPPAICRDPGFGEVTLHIRVEFRNGDGELCDPGRKLYRLSFPDGSGVGGTDNLDWESDGTVLAGTVTGVRIREGQNQIRFTMPGEDGCPYWDEGRGLRGASRVAEVRIEDCPPPPGPGDETNPGGGPG